MKKQKRKSSRPNGTWEKLVRRSRDEEGQRENEWGDKLHAEFGKRGELLRASESKSESLLKQRDEAREREIRAEEERKIEAEALQQRCAEKEKEGESLPAMLAEAAKKTEEEKRETTRAMSRVLGDLNLSHSRRRLRVAEEKKKLEGETDALRAELVQAENKEKEVEDVEKGGTGSSSQKTIVDAATNTARKTYAQAAAQTQAAVIKEKGKGKDKERCPNTPAAKSEGSKASGSVVDLPHQFAFVEIEASMKKSRVGRRGPNMRRWRRLSWGTHQLADVRDTVSRLPGGPEANPQQCANR